MIIIAYAVIILFAFLVIGCKHCCNLASYYANDLFKRMLKAIGINLIVAANNLCLTNNLSVACNISCGNKNYISTVNVVSVGIVAIGLFVVVTLGPAYINYIDSAFFFGLCFDFGLPVDFADRKTAILPYPLFCSNDRR